MVGRFVGLLVCRYVDLSVCLSRLCFFGVFGVLRSVFCITAPAQLHVTDAVVFTALPTAPAHHITAPAQPPRLRVSYIQPCFLIVHHVQYFCLGSCQEVRQKFFFFHFYSFIFMGGGQNRHFAQFGPIADPPCLTPLHPLVILLQVP